MRHKNRGKTKKHRTHKNTGKMREMLLRGDFIALNFRPRKLQSLLQCAVVSGRGSPLPFPPDLRPLMCTDAKGSHSQPDQCGSEAGLGDNVPLAPHAKAIPLPARMQIGPVGHALDALGIFLCAPQFTKKQNLSTIMGFPRKHFLFLCCPQGDRTS